MIWLVAKSVHLQSGAANSSELFFFCTRQLPATCYLETRLMRAVRRTCNRCLSPQVPPKRKQKQTFHFKNIYSNVCLQQHSGSTTGSDFFFFKCWTQKPSRVSWRRTGVSNVCLRVDSPAGRCWHHYSACNLIRADRAPQIDTLSYFPGSNGPWRVEYGTRFQRWCRAAAEGNKKKPTGREKRDEYRPGRYIL